MIFFTLLFDFFIFVFVLSVSVGILIIALAFLALVGEAIKEIINFWVWLLAFICDVFSGIAWKSYRKHKIQKSLEVFLNRG